MKREGSQGRSNSDSKERSACNFESVGAVHGFVVACHIVAAAVAQSSNAQNTRPPSAVQTATCVQLFPTPANCAQHFHSQLSPLDQLCPSPNTPTWKGVWRVIISHMTTPRLHTSAFSHTRSGSDTSSGAM